MSWPRAALLSLSDKRGAAAFARALIAHGTRIVASGGTAKHLESAGIEVTPVETLTGFSELLGGRVKTLHPHVHAPILARRDVGADMAALTELQLDPIDLVAVTLYPFEEHAPSLDDAGAIEEIDIGGVALLRAAAKNAESVIVVHDPSQYAEVIDALESGGPDPIRRREWAARTFARTARYDAAIASELARRTPAGETVDATPADPADAAGVGASSGALQPPAVHVISYQRVRMLRYGENPHQAAALYARWGEAAALQAWKEGKELSYNNLLDLEVAVALAGRFDEPACVIVKHAQPCGAATAATAAEAWRLAHACDPLSAFGGIVALNRALDAGTASLIAPRFIECVAATDFDSAGVEALKSKKALRLVRLTSRDLESGDRWSLRAVGRWALVEGEAGTTAPEWRVVTRRAPDPAQRAALEFAWEVAAAARSNAIAIARSSALIGLGSGQTSRVDAVDVALMKARRAGHDVRGAALASDGFFPFADNVEHAAEAGVAAIVQPGGSKRDPEVIAACDRLGIAMLFTDRRAFRH
ncbi:MAG: bifunctional phosphoribosylaminoimidazolecarboxamide formyltransferase/IMP cyclohydrolase [Candidatus Eisenbacteria bacterium]|nr:bifunctional phosphoribosylaminoimidazolecarboxamide formyltransferase/IMP cyclohydrolase [Candidatus Eisenbacteria bacterium]